MNVKPTFQRTRLLLISALLIVFLLACQALAPKSSDGSPERMPTGPAPTLVLGEQAVATASAVTENGAPLLPDPLVGLAGLQSYHAELTQSVTGSLDGQPYERQTLLKYSRDADAVEHTQWVLSGEELAAAGGFGDPTRARTVIRTRDGALYQMDFVSGGCQGQAIAGSLDEWQDPPAELLLPVDRADPIGSQTINGIPARGYRFNAGSFSLAQSEQPPSGELWLAEDGGFVVRYTLEVPASQAESSLHIAQSWQYELTEANTLEVSLPAACTPVLLEIPASADALDVQRSGGLMTFHTPSAAAQVVAFYQRNLPAQGWTLTEQTLSGPLKLPFILLAEQGSQVLSVRLDPTDENDPVDWNNSGAGLEITVTVMDLSAEPSEPDAAADGSAAAEPSATAEPSTSASAPTLDAAQVNLPEGVPLYPGSTDLERLGQMITITAPGAPEVVGQYYRETLPKNGWSLQVDTPTDTTTVLMFQKDEQTLVVLVKPAEVAGQSMLTFTLGE